MTEPGTGKPIAARPRAALTAEDADALAEQLKVLGNAKRLRLLQFLVQPHYIEEIASELGMARQTAQEHMEKLLDIGVVERMRGRRDSGPVTEYVVVPHRLFSILMRFGKLGGLEPEAHPADDMRQLTSPIGTTAQLPIEQDTARLHIVHGMHVGRTMALTGSGPWLIGREPTAQVCIDYDPFVSTRHAEVRRDESGAWSLTDLYSSNGTQVDWQGVERGASQTLLNGTLLGIGKSLLLFRTA